MGPSVDGPPLLSVLLDLIKPPENPKIGKKSPNFLQHWWSSVFVKSWLFCNPLFKFHINRYSGDRQSSSCVYQVLRRSDNWCKFQPKPYKNSMSAVLEPPQSNTASRSAITHPGWCLRCYAGIYLLSLFFLATSVVVVVQRNATIFSS